MSLESVSFLTYFLARLPAGSLTEADTLLLHQDGAICQLTVGALLDALLVEAGAGEPVTVIGETTLLASHGTIFVNSPEGGTVLIHLPVYGGVSARKRYRIKNVGAGIVQLDALDAKTINGEASIELLPGDDGEVVKDGANWQAM